MAGKKWSNEEAAIGLHGGMEVMLLDPAQLSASDKNVRATLDLVKEWMASGVPLPPAGASWVTQPGVSVSGFTVSVDATGQASFQGTVKDFPAYSYTATAPAEGLLKLVVVYARPDGSYGVSVGDAAQSPVQPPYPVTALFVTLMVVTPTGAIIQQPASYVTSVQVIRNGVAEPEQTGKAVVDLGYDEWDAYDFARAYEPGDTFRGAGGLYEVVTGWAANTYSLEFLIPAAKVTLLSNLDTPALEQDVDGAITITGRGYYATASTMTFTLAPDAAAGQAVRFYAADAIREGKRLTLRFVYNGITAVTVDPAYVSGDVGFPSAAMAGDVVAYELFAYEAGLFTLVRKYIEGKENLGGTGGSTAALPYQTFATTGAVTASYATSPNWKGPASTTTGITVATKVVEGNTVSTIPDGGDLRIILEGCAGQTIAIGGSGNVDFFTGAALDSITLPASGNALLLVNNVDGVLRWSLAPGAASLGEAAQEPNSTVLNFTNIDGHYRTASAMVQTAAVTFTKTGSKPGSTIVQKFTSDGVNTLNVSGFTCEPLNTDFTLGGILTAGTYRLYFNDEGDIVTLSIATVGAAGGTVALTAPANISVVSNNYNEMTVTWQ